MKRESTDRLAATESVKSSENGTGADGGAVNQDEQTKIDVDGGAAEAWVYVWNDTLEGLNSDIWR